MINYLIAELRTTIAPYRRCVHQMATATRYVVWINTVWGYRGAPIIIETNMIVRYEAASVQKLANRNFVDSITHDFFSVNKLKDTTNVWLK